MPKRKLTRKERGENRWRKRMEPKETDVGKRAALRARRIVFKYARMVQFLFYPLLPTEKEELERQISNAIMLEFERGRHEGAGNPYCG